MQDKNVYVELKVGDIVKHKVMPGKFVIICRYADDKGRGISTAPQPDYELRGEDGNVISGVFRQELIS